MWLKKAKQEREVPWVRGVHCQWFEVGRESEPSEEQAGDGGITEDIVEKMKRIHREQTSRFDSRAKEKICVANEKIEPNGWLERVRWADHMEKLDPKLVLQAAWPIKDDEPVLRGIWESFERVLEQARATARAKTVGAPALFEIERKEIHVKPNRPFNNRLEDDTWERYKAVWRKLICVWQRTRTWDDKKRPVYRLMVR